MRFLYFALLSLGSSLCGIDKANQNLMVRELGPSEIASCQKLFAIQQELRDTLISLDKSKHQKQIDLLTKQYHMLELQLEKMYQLQPGLKYSFSPTQGSLFELLDLSQFDKLSEIEKQQVIKLKTESTAQQQARFIRKFSHESNIKLMSQLIKVTKKLKRNILEMDGLISKAPDESKKSQLRKIKNQLQTRFDQSAKMLDQGFGLSNEKQYYFQTEAGRIYLELTAHQLKLLSKLPDQP